MEVGNVATAWSENPEDTEARVAAARQAAENAQNSASNAQTGVNNLRNFTDTVFRDGVIDRAERAAIESYLNQKLSVDADFAQIRQNPYLAGAALTNLTNAKTALDTALQQPCCRHQRRNCKRRCNTCRTQRGNPDT